MISIQSGGQADSKTNAKAFFVMCMVFFVGYKTNAFSAVLLVAIVIAYYFFRPPQRLRVFKAQFHREPYWVRVAALSGSVAFLYMLVFYLPCKQTGELACFVQTIPSFPYAVAVYFAFNTFIPHIFLSAPAILMGTTIAWFMLGAIVGIILQAQVRAGHASSNWPASSSPKLTSPPSQTDTSK